jgi:hypothetical protein
MDKAFLESTGKPPAERLYAALARQAKCDPDLERPA